MRLADLINDEDEALPGVAACLTLPVFAASLIVGLVALSDGVIFGNGLVYAAQTGVLYLVGLGLGVIGLWAPRPVRRLTISGIVLNGIFTALVAWLWCALLLGI